MIKLKNQSSTMHHTFLINGVAYALKPQEHMYFEDNKISEIEAICDLRSDLDMENYAGQVIQRDQLDIVGKGHGANKTDTNVYGITITEDFGIGDELFISWVFDPLIVRDVEPVLHFGFSPVTSEVGKLVSAEISLLGGNGGQLINRAPTSVLNLTDLPIPSTAFESADASVIVPISEIQEGYEDMSIRLKRVAASANDLIGDVALHHVYIEYAKYLV